MFTRHISDEATLKMFTRHISDENFPHGRSCSSPRPGDIPGGGFISHSCVMVNGACSCT